MLLGYSYYDSERLAGFIKLKAQKKVYARDKK